LNNKSPIYYLHFEDLRLSNFEKEDFSKLNEIFEEVLGKKGIYFLDEVQNVNSWEIYVRSLVDSGKEVYITGSNSTLMSKELGTRLTGRHISHELYPFSFKEFCIANKKEPSLKQFESYMNIGGLPEYVLQKDHRILESLVKDVIYKDILVRHKVRDEVIVEKLVTYVISNIGKELSYNKLKNLLGVGSTNTIIALMNALEDAYLLFTINLFDFSLKKQLRNQRKVYCVDNGIISKVSFKFSDNLGRLLENTVFIELKRRESEIYFYKDSHECDFIVKNKSNTFLAIQVCYDVTEDNQKREFAGLIEAMNKIKVSEGLILTLNQDDEFIIEGKKIVMLPVWKWLLLDSRV
jgi:predicted AAA+ superfamily ATPase